MSDQRDARRAARARETRLPEPAVVRGGGAGRQFITVASGENVVMTEASSGRSWFLGLDDGVPVWQPIAFRGGAERAPRGDRDGEEG